MIATATEAGHDNGRYPARPEIFLSFARRQIGCWIVVAIWLVYTWPLWRDSGNAFLGDLAFVDVPTRVYAARALRNGWFPTWTDDLLGGIPLFTESQAGIAYPLFGLMLLNPEPKGHDWFLAAHYLIIGLGTYLLARQNGVRSASAGLAATLYMTCWGLRYTHSAAAMFTAWVWQPLSLWLLGKYFAGQRAALWLFMIVVAAALLAGAAAVAISTLPLCVGYWLYQSWNRRWLSWLPDAVLCALVPLGLAAVQIIPLYGYFLQSTRYEQVFEELASGTAPPWYIFAPWGFGPAEPQNLEEPPRAAWPGQVVYVATVIGFAVAVAGIWRRREAWFWLAAAALFVSITMETPLLRLVGSIPPFSWFRYASAYIWAAMTCAYLLAGMGFSRLETWCCDRRQSRWPSLNWAFAAVMALLLACVVVSADFRRYLSDGPFYTEFNPALAGDLASWNERHGHIRILGPEPPPASEKSIGSWSEAAWRERVAALAPDHNLLHDVPSINHYMQFTGTVTNKRLFEVGQLLLRREPNAFRAAAVTHLSLEGANPPLGYDRIASGSGFFYRSAEPRPPAWMVFDAAYEADRATRCARLAGQDFDPYRTALVETPLVQLDPQPALPATVEMIPDLKGHKEFQVNTAAQGLLVMSYTYYTQLEATIDGAPATVLPVNHAFCGVVVPAGDHRVAILYNPWEIYLGLAISAATLTLVLWRIVRLFRLQQDSCGA